MNDIKKLHEEIVDVISKSPLAAPEKLTKEKYDQYMHRPYSDTGNFANYATGTIPVTQVRVVHDDLDEGTAEVKTSWKTLAKDYIDTNIVELFNDGNQCSVIQVLPIGSSSKNYTSVLEKSPYESDQEWYRIEKLEENIFLISLTDGASDYDEGMTYSRCTVTVTAGGKQLDPIELIVNLNGGYDECDAEEDEEDEGDS